MLQLDRHRPSPGVPELHRRLGWLLGFVAVAFLALAGRLWQLQVVRGERYFQRSTDNFVKEQWIPAVRGRILDHRGALLVDNRPSFNVYVTPRYYDAVAHASLVRLLGLGPANGDALWAATQKTSAGERYRSLLVLADIDRDRVALIEQARAELPGVEVRDVPHRNYPHGTLAAHVLGYMNQIGEVELEEHAGEGYEAGDYLGRYGIEKQWESYLRGKKGVERFVVDARGQRRDDGAARNRARDDPDDLDASDDLDALIQGARFVPPAPGHNVVLTLDAELQRIAERALRNHPAGGIAVVDVTSGKILALVSKPAFDPNVMTGHLTRAEEAQMEADPYKPFLDKTLRQHYYPGSTYKFVTAVAGLEDGRVTPEERVLCKGWHALGRRTFRCSKEHGSVGLQEAMTQSCNVYFWHLAEKVGIDRLARVASDFGFGAPTGLGLNGDVPGRVPWREWYERAAGGFRIGYTLNTAIGQGDTEVTVLQLALAYAALANGGNLWVPQLVERVETAAGKVVAEYPPRLRRRLEVAGRTLALVRRGLWGVVNDPKGTAFAARPDGITVAGKTGTAQVRKLTRQPDEARGWHPLRDHAWFAAYAPAEDPKIAVVVLVEHGGKGGHVAAPVAMEILRGYFQTVNPMANPAAPAALAPAPPADGRPAPTAALPLPPPWPRGAP